MRPAPIGVPIDAQRSLLVARPCPADRGVRMLERDKNSPAVLLWSLGNESGGWQFLGSFCRQAGTVALLLRVLPPLPLLCLLIHNAFCSAVSLAGTCRASTRQAPAEIGGEAKGRTESRQISGSSCSGASSCICSSGMGSPAPKQRLAGSEWHMQCRWQGGGGVCTKVGMFEASHSRSWRKSQFQSCLLERLQASFKHPFCACPLASSLGSALQQQAGCHCGSRCPRRSHFLAGAPMATPCTVCLKWQQGCDRGAPSCHSAMWQALAGAVAAAEATQCSCGVRSSRELPRAAHACPSAWSEAHPALLPPVPSAGYGPAHLAMAGYLRARDSSRPVRRFVCCREVGAGVVVIRGSRAQQRVPAELPPQHHASCSAG